jgi:hypothetical protein
MSRLAKKYHLDELETAEGQRSQRRNRNHRSLTSALHKFERRHSWGYAKRRAVLNEE